MNRRVLLVLAAALLAGCGGSVADSDAPAASVEPVVTSPFCAAVQANAAALRPLSALTARGNAPPEELSDTVAAVRRSGDDLLRAAPDDIRRDVETYVRAVDLQLDALLANGGDGAALSRDTDLTAQVGSPEATAAGRRLQAYVERTCDASATR